MAGTVTVACKLPNGIRLDLYNDRVSPDLAPSIRESVVLNGSRFKRNDAGIAVDQWLVRGGEFGYGITENVDADFWTAWSEAHKDFGPVRGKLIFAMPKTSDVMKEADNLEGLRSGLEAIDPDKPAPGIEQVKDPGQ